MRYLKITGALLVFLSLMAAPAVAAKRPAYVHEYMHRYHQLVERHGIHTAGCELIGSKYAHNCAGPATKRRVMHSIATINRLLYVPPPAPVRAPAPIPSATITATASSQGTASTASSATASGSGSTYTGAGGILAKIRQCESGGNYSTNTGNGFSGAYQFTPQTWHATTGLRGNASDYPPSVQDNAAEKLYDHGAGAGNWPVCSR